MSKLKIGTEEADREFWEEMRPPRSPSEEDVIIYEKYIKGKVLLLGETKSLRHLVDEGLDFFPSDNFAKKGDWFNIVGFYDTIIGDGVLNFKHGLTLVDSIKNNCSRFVSRVFSSKIEDHPEWVKDRYEYTVHDYFPNSSEVIKSKDGYYYFVVWDF